MAFSPNGRVLASADGYPPNTFGIDKAQPLIERDASLLIRFWDIATGKEIHRLQGLGANVTSLSFSPDGSRLVSGSSDGTALIWDMSRTARAPALVAKDLTANDMDGLLQDLADKDAVRAYRAAWSLIANPRQTLPLLRNRLQPAVKADPKIIDRWIADLDSDKFAAAPGCRQGTGEVGRPGLGPNRSA